MDAMGEEECVGAGVVELFAIVTLDCLDGGPKLGVYMSKEICEDGVRVRFEF